MDVRAEDESRLVRLSVDGVFVFVSVRFEGVTVRVGVGDDLPESVRLVRVFAEVSPVRPVTVRPVSVRVASRRVLGVGDNLPESVRPVRVFAEVSPVRPVAVRPVAVRPVSAPRRVTAVSGGLFVSFHLPPSFTCQPSLPSRLR